MWCGAVGVGVFCVLTTTCVFQCQALNLPLIQAVKDYFHPTTTSATPILPEYEAVPASSSSNREGQEGVEGEPATRVPTGYEDSTTAAHDDDVSSPSYSNNTKERPYPPQNFPTTAPPGAREVYPGLTSERTSQRPSVGSGPQHMPYEQTNNNDVPDEQEPRTTVRTSFGGENYNDKSTENPTNYDTFVSAEDKCKSVSTSGQTNTTQEEPSRTGTPPSIHDLSEQPKVQTTPTSIRSSNKSQYENFIFPDDPRVVEAEGARKEGPRNATVPVPEGGPRTVINAPSKPCGKGRQMDANGNCRTIARK